MTNRHELQLDAESILACARDETGVDLGDNPGDRGFVERLAAVVDAIRALDLDPVTADVAAESLVEIVVVRSRLERDRRDHPAIADEDVTQPILIAGFPRAGTTFLHALLDCDPNNHAPQWWEVMHPSPPPGRADGDDHRHQVAQREVADFVRRCPDVRVAHPYFVEGDATLMECESFLTFDLRNAYPFALHRVPALLEVDLAGDPVDAFDFHRTFLRHLQWGREPRRWALKGTAHQFLLPALLATYPDAVVIWPHRDPATLIASLVELSAVLAENLTGAPADRGAIGHATLEGIGAGLSAAMSDPSIDATNVVHVRYDDLTADPVQTIRSVYERFGLAFGPEFETAMRAWMADARHRSDRYGRFEYSLDRVGLTAAEVRARLSDYVDRFEL